MRRRLVAILLVAVALFAAYWLVLRGKSVEARLLPSEPVAAIGSGSDAVGVSAGGLLLTWLPPPEEGSLPLLPGSPPSGRRLTDTALQQARVLGAAPAALRPYVEGSLYGTSGVVVLLAAGVELRFGDASRAAAKWRAAAAVLADPSVTTLDYIDVRVPSRPATGGTGHTLPPVP